MMRKLVFTCISIISLISYSYAQDTLAFGSDAIKKKWITSPNGYYLHGLLVNSVSVHTFLENVMNSLPGKIKTLKGDTSFIPGQLLLSKCTFTNLKTYYTKLYFPSQTVSNFKTAHSFTLDSCILKGEADISGIKVDHSHLFALNHNTLNNFMIENSDGWFSFFDNNIVGKITAQADNITQFDLSGSNFLKTDTAILEIKDSKIGKLLMSGNNMKNLSVELTGDTLSQEYDLTEIINNGQKPDSGGVALLIFKNCYINANFILTENTKRISVAFVNCSFGKDLDLKNLYVHDLLFDNCTKFAEQIDLNTIKATQLNVSFVNTELKNFRFNYLGKFKLFFPPGSKDEYKISTFENLLAKFKLEGKLESYQNIDIEYTQYQNSVNGFLGSVKDVVSRAWWYYSYRKYYILYWTAGFLLLFYLLNIRYWEKLLEVYPVIKESKRRAKKETAAPTDTGKRPLTTIFIFTAFIFFSLKIDFDKLSYKNPRVVWYFFFQYVLGLVCVFFIVNAILKI